MYSKKKKKHECAKGRDLVFRTWNKGIANATITFPSNSYSEEAMEYHMEKPYYSNDGDTVVVITSTTTLYIIIKSQYL